MSYRRSFDISMLYSVTVFSYQSALQQRHYYTDIIMHLSRPTP